jgi:hypothetical protein
MIRTLSAAALLGLLASPVLAQDCSLAGANFGGITVEDTSREPTQGYGPRTAVAPNNRGTAGYTQRTASLSVTGQYSNCPEQTGTATFTETTNIFGPGRSPAGKILGVEEGTTCGLEPPVEDISVSC